MTPAFQAGVSPYDCLWGKGPGSAGLSGQGQPCISEQHTQAGIPHRASLRSAQAWGWTEDAPTCFPGWHVASGISVCSLSLVQVGCFLKTPRFPIWVVCSESHFSVLFSQQLELLRDWRTERLFDLYGSGGAALALVTTSLLAVLCGDLISRIPNAEKTIKLASGVVFLIFGVLSIVEAVK